MVADAAHALSPLDFTHACCGSAFHVVRIRGGIPSSQASSPLLLRAVASIEIAGCSAAFMPDRSSGWPPIISPDLSTAPVLASRTVTTTDSISVPSVSESRTSRQLAPPTVWSQRWSLRSIVVRSVPLPRLTHGAEPAGSTV